MSLLCLFFHTYLNAKSKNEKALSLRQSWAKLSPTNYPQWMIKSIMLVAFVFIFYIGCTTGVSHQKNIQIPAILPSAHSSSDSVSKEHSVLRPALQVITRSTTYPAASSSEPTSLPSAAVFQFPKCTYNTYLTRQRCSSLKPILRGNPDGSLKTPFDVQKLGIISRTLHNSTLPQRLQGRELYLIGDSLTLQWFRELVNCILEGMVKKESSDKSPQAKINKDCLTRQQDGLTLCYLRANYVRDLIDVLEEHREQLLGSVVVMNVGSWYNNNKDEYSKDMEALINFVASGKSTSEHGTGRQLGPRKSDWAGTSFFWHTCSAQHFAGPHAPMYSMKGAKIKKCERFDFSKGALADFRDPPHILAQFQSIGIQVIDTKSFTRFEDAFMYHTVHGTKKLNPKKIQQAPIDCTHWCECTGCVPQLVSAYILGYVKEFTS